MKAAEAAEGDPLVKGGPLASDPLVKAEAGGDPLVSDPLASGPLARSSSLPSEAGKLLQEIREDTSSGAAELAEQGAKLLLDALKQGQGKEIRAVGRALIDAQPAMAPMLNLVNHLFHAIESLQDPQAIKEKGRTAVQAFLDSLRTASEKIRRHALGLLKGERRVMTHSYSSTVLGVLEGARGIEVICPEARPLGEGLRTAKELGAKGIRVRLVTDFAALSLVGESDLVMVGADAITLKGVVNKIGTYGLALAARAKKIPFYVLAGKEKFLPAPFSDAIRIEKNDPKEITRESVANVVVENVYFDLTPLALITGVVTQEGVIAGSKVRKLLEGMRINKGLEGP
jgi:translation initiation factor 2B subunit (eIF-2B alpha/beta/delta family)